MSLYSRPSLRPTIYWCEPGLPLTESAYKNLSVLAGNFIRLLGLRRRDGVAVTTFSADGGALFLIWVKGGTNYTLSVDTKTPDSKQLHRHSMARLAVIDVALNSD